MKHRSLTSSWRVHVALAVFTITIIWSMVYVLRTGTQMSVDHGPQIDAAMEIKLEATTAHLWLEEALGGDGDKGIEEVLAHLDSADWFAQAMLAGGKNREGTFNPLEDPRLRDQIREVQGKLEEFRQITLERWSAKEVSRSGTEIDQKYDAVFAELIHLADSVETEIQHVVTGQITAFRNVQMALIGCSLVLAILASLAFRRYIADRNRAEHALQESEENLAITLHSIGDAVIATDTEGAVTRMNPVAERMTGWRLSEALGSPVEQVFNILNEESRKPVPVPVRDVLREGTLVGLANRTALISKDGKEYPIADSAAPIRGVAGQVIGVVMVFRDVTEERRAEQALRDHAGQLESQNVELEAQQEQLISQQRRMTAMNENLARARVTAETGSRSKSEFLANMSHEIRTPMTAILGFAENLLDEHLSDSDRLNAIYTIRRNGDHLLQIINDILDLSKIEAGKLEVENIRFSLVEIVSDVQSLMRARAEERNLAFDIEFTGAVPETILSDPTRLRQILVNLIGNAVKFTKTGGVRLVTRLLNADSAGASGSDSLLVQFEVTDTGIGMKREALARLFEPFSQADSSTTRKFGGTGLGLSISRRLAELLGGDISAESKPGAGSTFRLTINAGPLEGMRMLENPAQSMNVKPEAAQSDTPPIPKLDCRVLLAEDGRDNQRLIAHLLEKAGAKVTIAENGRVAAEAALGAMHGKREADPAIPFDVILMDMQMPVMDGYEATRLLRRKGYRGPIIALTAHAMEGDRAKCLQAGCTDYASKPIDRRKLIAAIQRTLNLEPAAV